MFGKKKDAQQLRINQLEVETNAQKDDLMGLRGMIGRLLGLSHGGKRYTYEIYGYPESLNGEAGFLRMYKLSRRMGLANRITWGVPKTCWRDGFEIYASDDEEADQIELDELTQLFDTDLMSKFERADILNRIGQFSCMYVGIAGDDPETPIWESGARSIDELFFKAYGYDGIEISGTVQDVTDRRFGEPEFYTVKSESRGDSDKDTTISAKKVHWSRIIHMCEGALDSEVEGMGVLEPVFNRLLDFDKAVGGSSEAYFRNARRIITQEIDPTYATALVNNESARKDFEEKTKAFTNESKDWLVSSGAKINQLQATHASPLDTAKVILWEVSGYTGIPLRVLTGEGAGQLAGSEDQLAYNSLIADRQKQICTPWVRDLFNILKQCGLIELPDGYDIRYPTQRAVTEIQEVEIAHKKAQTVDLIVKAKTQPGGDDIDVIGTLRGLGIEIEEETVSNE